MAKAVRRNSAEFGLAELREMSRLHAPEALERVVQILRDKRYPKTSLAAAQMILDRGYGRVPNVTAGEGGEGPATHTLEVRWRLPESKEPILLEAKRVVDEEED
jgi:hypothetical protein